VTEYKIKSLYLNSALLNEQLFLLSHDQCFLEIGHFNKVFLITWFNKQASFIRNEFTLPNYVNSNLSEGQTKGNAT